MSEHHRSAEWQKFRRRVKPIIAAQLPLPCVNPPCLFGGLVHPEQPWELGHLPGVPIDSTDISEFGPAHKQCNQRDGGKVGAARRAQKTAETKRVVNW